MTMIGIILAAMAAYGIFAALRGSTRIDERENEKVYEAKMHEAAERVDEEARDDPGAI